MDTRFRPHPSDVNLDDFFTGFDGGDDQINAFGETLRDLGSTRKYTCYHPYAQAPYPSPIQAAELATYRLVVALLQARRRVRLWGLSAGALRALKTYELLVKGGFGEYVDKVVMIDPPWDGLYVVPWYQKYPTRAFGSLPHMANRKLAAQCKAIDTTATTINMSLLDPRRIEYIWLPGNRSDTIDSQLSKEMWESRLPVLPEQNWHELPPECQHRYLTFDRPEEERDWEGWEATQGPLKLAIGEILSRLLSLSQQACKVRPTPLRSRPFPLLLFFIVYFLFNVN